jgi:hypothetical protein
VFALFQNPETQARALVTSLLSKGWKAQGIAAPQIFNYNGCKTLPRSSASRNSLASVREIVGSVKIGGRCLSGVLLFIAFIFATTVSAAPLTAPEREQLLAQKQTLLRQILQNPANIDIILAYAKVSAQVGDNEAAASALERLLLFKPNMPQVELELGALYFRMGSFELARSYLEKANADNPPPELKPRIDKYLSEIPRLERAQRVTANVGSQLNPIVQASATRDRVTGPCDDRTQLNVVFLYGAELTVTGLNGVSETTKTPGFAISVPCAGASPSQPFALPPGGTAAFLRALNGEVGRNGGANVSLTASNLQLSGIADIISGDFSASLAQAVTQSSSSVTQTIFNTINNNNINPPVNNTTNNNNNCISQSNQQCP